MDNLRLFLFAALAMVLVLIWQAWQRDYAPVADAERSQAQEAVVVDAPDDIPQAPKMADVPATLPGTTATSVKSSARVRITTDVLDLMVDTVGGDIREARLRAYPQDVETPRQPFLLMNDQLPNFFITQSGLLSTNAAPDHYARYRAERNTYQLAPGAKQLQARLHWSSPTGIDIVKIYTLQRGSYFIDVRYEVHNRSAQAWTGRAYRQLQRTEIEEAGQSSFVYTYMGGVIHSPEDKYQKLAFDDMAEQDLSRDFSAGWAAMIQHYFLAAWVPPAQQVHHYYTKVLDGTRYVLGMLGPEVQAPPGGQAAFSAGLYIGPKLQDRLAAIAPGLELTVDYGHLTFLAQPLFWLLEKIHALIGNWGWAIAILTLLIKLAFYKLSEASYRSMANMRRLQPRLMALKERYGSDRQRLQQAMMEIYKKEKINPLGGCLPILVQIPVFIALYWVLLESVELRQAPFMLWIKDLSRADPFFVLPALMGVTMLIQQKLNPAPIDPVQQKVMMILPWVFTIFFAFFPAGLVLYWVVNNTLSIAQQAYITRRMEQTAAA